jgi:hypothetical protein
MAMALYKGYLIVSIAHQDSSSKRWRVMVDVSRREPRPVSNTIWTDDVFPTKDEAESAGVLKAREWIEKQP